MAGVCERRFVDPRTVDHVQLWYTRVRAVVVVAVEVLHVVLLELVEREVVRRRVLAVRACASRERESAVLGAFVVKRDDPGLLKTRASRASSVEELPRRSPRGTGSTVAREARENSVGGTGRPLWQSTFQHSGSGFERSS